MLDKDNQKFDLCVVGSGPAGIIITLEFARLNPGKRICLIEFGYKGLKKKNSLDETIINVNPINHHDPYECTNKGLGGSSQTWGGRCVMYDEIDFIPRPIINDGCTWSVNLFDDVKKHVDKTCEYFECGKNVFSVKNESGKDKTILAERFTDGDITGSKIERWSKPTNFGKRYRYSIESNKNIHLIEASEARNLIINGNCEISAIEIRNVQNRENSKIYANHFVLAAGTQETTRLLLRNKHIFKNLGYVPDSLGKYYQGHISGKIASVKFYGDPQKTEYGFIRDEDGVYLKRRFQFTTDFLLKRDLLNTAIWLDNPLYYDYEHRCGAMSLMYLVMITPYLGKKLAPPAIARSITSGKSKNIGKHLWNVIKDIPGSILIPATIFFKRYFPNRKLPGVFLYNSRNIYALNFHAEQIPYSGNSMSIDKDGETLIINYSLTDSDIDSVLKLHKELDEYLRKINCGELIYWYPEQLLKDKIRSTACDGIHQSGTTRISSEPENGVVDENLKVWGTKNLFICSSSVFPTSGQANPTFFLGAFAVRLANFLSS